MRPVGIQTQHTDYIVYSDTVIGILAREHYIGM
jgi:hypothetical protein